MLDFALGVVCGMAFLAVVIAVIWAIERKAEKRRLEYAWKSEQIADAIIRHRVFFPHAD